MCFSTRSCLGRFIIQILITVVRSWRKNLHPTKPFTLPLFALIYYPPYWIYVFIFHAPQILNTLSCIYAPCVIFTIFQDRDEITRQLACTSSNDDYDDKSSPSAERHDSPSSKTTKSWIWTSNTVDTESGTPTRHRRQTEFASIPLSTKSTRDFPTNGRTDEVVTTYKPLAPTARYDPTIKTEGDISLESNATGISQSFEREDITTSDSVVDGSSEKPKEQTDTFGIATTTIEYRSGELRQEEYPSAINQGQLFSIIENGNGILTYVYVLYKAS